MQHKILFILTNHSQLGSTDKPTGWYLPEVAHPYNYLKQFHDIVIASPKGGKTPMDPSSLEAFKNDPECIAFLSDTEATKAVNESVKLSSLNLKEFKAIVFPGGHGPMWDLVSDTDSQNAISTIYERGGVVGAVCHGPAALVNVILSNGTKLLKGKRVTCFSNAEEDAVQLSSLMPFMLETEIISAGGLYEKQDLWKEHVVVDGNLVTGQNPASSTLFAKKIHELL